MWLVIFKRNENTFNISNIIGLSILVVILSACFKYIYGFIFYFWNN